MGATMVFDTLHCVRKMKNAGFTEQQAEAQAEMVVEIMEFIEEKFATKQDLRELEQRLIIKLGSLMVGCTSVLAALMKMSHG